MEPLGPCGVYEEAGRIYTESARPGKRIYGERLRTVSGKEYREWDPRRSKLSAYIVNGGRDLHFSKDSRILYLGASSGTTASHVSDMCPEGTVSCVEFAPRMFKELVGNSEGRMMMPILSDATKPQEYSMFGDRYDLVYQDVAQKRQADILCDNMDFYHADHGMVAIKARSEDVTASPKEVFEMSVARIKERGYKVTDVLELGPYEKDHAMIVVSR